MAEPKYEYMLNTWGGFYNDSYQRIHGYKPGYYWFDTAEERETYIEELQKTEKLMKAYHLVGVKEEGTHTRKRTIAKMLLVYNGTEYPYEHDFGYAYPPESARFMFFDGNYSCDCNKSTFLLRAGFDVPDLDCGDEIAVKDFEVVLVEFDGRGEI